MMSGEEEVTEIADDADVSVPGLTDEEVDELLCEYAVVLDEVKESVEQGKFHEAKQKLQELRDSSECDVCAEVLDEVIAANENAANCQGDCEESLAKLNERIEWAKEAFCPTVDDAE